MGSEEIKIPEELLEELDKIAKETSKLNHSISKEQSKLI